MDNDKPTARKTRTKIPEGVGIVRNSATGKILIADREVAAKYIENLEAEVVKLKRQLLTAKADGIREAVEHVRKANGFDSTIEGMCKGQGFKDALDLVSDRIFIDNLSPSIKAGE